MSESAIVVPCQLLGKPTVMFHREIRAAKTGKDDARMVMSLPPHYIEVTFKGRAVRIKTKDLMNSAMNILGDEVTEPAAGGGINN